MSKADGEKLWCTEDGTQMCLVKNIDGQILEVPTKYTWDNYAKFSPFCMGEPYSYEANVDISKEVDPEYQKKMGNIGLIFIAGVIIFGLVTGSLEFMILIWLAWTAFHPKNNGR
ncbi:hypothetical protein [Clostridium cadaveris]|uniref:hypothetical protein n=1 Tax=Clostridium cadaveris TaxID=1529 RepID=UPI000C06A77F|nr:hypothetical protein [Clostridium cadaveris]